MDETQKPKTTAKDFFINLGAIVALYTTVVSLLRLLFTVIERAYPQITFYGYYSGSRISLPVATLIIFFPIYILLMWLLEKGYSFEPWKRTLSVRRWLTYITLFIAGLILAGDLVTVLYYFIDGQELTAGFILKVISVFVVAAAVFLYYITDIRAKHTPNTQRMWLGVGVIIILASIVWGFAVLGSPRTQRLVKYDEQKVADLQNIQWQIVNYWQLKRSLPSKLENLNDSISGFIVPTDPQTNKVYEYRVISSASFELCATFNKESRGTAMNNYYYETRSIKPMSEDNWQHKEGNTCFQRTIDPELYPPKTTVF